MLVALGREMTSLYVMTHVPNMEKLVMLPDTSACEMTQLYVMTHVPTLVR